MERQTYRGETDFGLTIHTEYGLEIIPNGDDRVNDRYTVILTEIDDNQGMSVTNAYEYLATAIWRDTLQYKTTPYLIRWIEHYEGRTQWDEVELKYDPDNDRFYDPRWRVITKEEVYEKPQR